MSTFAQWYADNEATVMVIVAWIVREWHVQWPRMVAVYPYLKANGGVVGILRTVAFGEPTTQLKT